MAKGSVKRWPQNCYHGTYEAARLESIPEQCPHAVAIRQSTTEADIVRLFGRIAKRDAQIFPGIAVPGTPSRHTFLPFVRRFGGQRIPCRRMPCGLLIINRTVPVQYTLPDICRHVVEAVVRRRVGLLD